jgi:ATP-dependent Zn protease
MRDNDPLNKKPGMPPKPGLGKPNKPLKAMVFWVLLVLVLLIAFQMFEMGKTPEYRISYSEFIKQVDAGNIQRLTIKGLEVRGSLLTPTTIPIGPTGNDQAKQREVKVEDFSVIPSKTIAFRRESWPRTRTP